MFDILGFVYHHDYGSNFNIMGETIEEFLINILIAIVAVFVLPGCIFGYIKGKDPLKEGRPWLVSCIFWIITISITTILYVLFNTPEV